MDDLHRKMDVLEAEAVRLRDLLAQAGADAVVQGVAHDLVLIAADARHASALAASEARHALILESATDYAIITMDLAGRITDWNAGARNVLGWEEAEARGQLAHLFFTPEDRAAGVPEEEMESARTRGRAADERWRLRRDGSRFWASGLMMPLRHEGEQLQGYLKVLRDRTEQRRAEEALRAAAAEKDLLMAEVHHRVRNSLQLVQNLLTLQARAAEDAATAAQLGESAGRVQTIAAIHEQLYRSGVALDVAVGPYLRGLAESMGHALASAAEGRTIRLDADEATWPAREATTLGLVAAELVTNALKYGRGMVTVTFRQPAGAAQAVLTVSDEGPGVPESFDPAHGRGLGMRLVTGLLRGPGAGLEVARGGPGACFVARLPVPAESSGQV